MKETNIEYLPRKIDEIVCQWSMEFGIPLDGNSLDTLVDRLVEIYQMSAMGYVEAIKE